MLQCACSGGSRGSYGADAAGAAAVVAEGFFGGALSPVRPLAGVAVHELVHDLEKRDSKHSYKHYHMDRLKKMHKNPDNLRFQHMKSFKVTLCDYETDAGNAKETSVLPATWKWWGYIPSIGFIAAFLQFIGATFFAIAVICGVPGVIGATEWQLQQAFIWTMQCAGSVFFVISSWMMMVEEQENWYMPALGRIGWHASFWNLIGSIGFLLSAIFGYLANVWGFHGLRSNERRCH